MPDWRNASLATVALGIVALAGAAVVGWTWQQTSATIERNEREYRLRALNEIVPPSRYDNALFDDTVAVIEPELLGTDAPMTVFRARSGGAPVAAILNVVAPDGYSGPIRLLVGIDYDGTLAGVRVAEHSETRGLGDKIEVSESDWILGLEGRSLGDPPVELWTVERYGGAFDQFTGATMTPRAVVKAVRNALVYFDTNREMLFEQTTTP